MKTAAPSRRDRIRSQLADLKMPGALESLDQVLSQVDGAKLGAAEAIEALLGAQISLRNNRRLQAAMRSSRLPAVKMLTDFDFTFQPSIKREQLDGLHELGFLERRENVIFLGPPGVGKTHLAISLAIAAAQHGRRVYYGTLADLITSLEEAQASGKLSNRLKTLTHPALLVVDEIGYLPITRNGAMLFFQLMARRYESFEEWVGGRQMAGAGGGGIVAASATMRAAPHRPTRSNDPPPASYTYIRDLTLPTSARVALAWRGSRVRAMCRNSASTPRRSPGRRRPAVALPARRSLRDERGSVAAGTDLDLKPRVPSLPHEVEGNDNQDDDCDDGDDRHHALLRLGHDVPFD